MRYWSVLVSADRYGAERLYAHETIGLHGPAGADLIGPGDRVALVADVDPPVIFAIGTAVTPQERDPDSPDCPDTPSADEGSDPFPRPLLLAYTTRLFDTPRQALNLIPPRNQIREVTRQEIDALTPTSTTPNRTWLVSVDIPIEAASSAEAVRQFWTYVHTLGPTELPAFVSPADDELSIQAFVHGDEQNQDPEEDE